MATSEGAGPWVSIDLFFHPTEAHIAAGRLTAEGIPVNLLGINHVSANWLFAHALGGIRLQVPLQYAELSRKILATAVNLEEFDLDRCPECGSANTTAHTGTWKLSFLAIHLLNIPLPWRRDRRQCEECGAAWTER